MWWWWCVCVRPRCWGQRMVFMFLLRRDILKMHHANFFSLVFFSPCCFRSQVSHTVSSSPLIHFFSSSHLSAPEIGNLQSFKYAHSKLGVNHHIVFITCSLSSLSRCAGGMRSHGVRKYSRCFWLQSDFFYWALPRGWGSSPLVLQPNKTDWLEGCSLHASQLVWLN